MFEDVRHGRSLILLLSLTDPDILRESKSFHHEIDVMKNLHFFRRITSTGHFKRTRSHVFIRITITKVFSIF